ncbi:MAG: MFS transporter [Chloroflexi bacterium]|nr:MFS transporter [Chloroflexota bacterium]
MGHIKDLPMLAAFQYRNYRLYWTGMVAYVAGNQIHLFASLWLVYELTGSPLYLGLVGGANAAGTLGFSLVGGVVADRVDRPKFVVLTQLCNGVLNFVLATLALTGLVNIWHLLIISFLSGVVSAFDSPARQAMIPYLIEDRKHLMSAIAMSSVIWQSTRIFGPVLAAMLLKIGGIAVLFYVNSAAYILMVAAIYFIRIPRELPRAGQSLWRSLTQGIDYVRKSSIFATLMGATLLNSLFGMSYVYLMPVFAGDVFKMGSEGFAFLMSSVGAGSLIGVLSSSAMGGIKHKGRLFLSGSIFFGVFLMLFSQSGLLYVSMGFALLASMSNYFYMVTVQTLLQALVPDELRGRVMSIYALVFSLQPMGSLIAGAVAQYYGAPFSVFIGGAVVSAFSIFILLASPATRRLTV